MWDAYSELLDALYVEENTERARRAAANLGDLLSQMTAHQTPATLAECRALIAEAWHDWATAVEFRKREIELRLSEIDAPSSVEIISAGPDDVADRYDLLAIALWNNGELEEALAALRKSEQLAEQYGFEFDGFDLRKDIEAELEMAHATSPKPSS